MPNTHGGDAIIIAQKWSTISNQGTYKESVDKSARVKKNGEFFGRRIEDSINWPGADFVFAAERQQSVKIAKMKILEILQNFFS